jgi:hypothetical protein
MVQQNFGAFSGKVGTNLGFTRGPHSILPKPLSKSATADLGGFPQKMRPSIESNKRFTNSRLIFAAAGVLVLLTAAPVSAQVQIFPSEVDWTVLPPFSNDQNAGTNISGAACTDIGARICLAVNDRSNFAQFFALGNRRIRPAGVIPLQPAQVGPLTFSRVDAEGAAFDGEHFYVVGSHGRASPPSEKANFLAFRFRVDPAHPPVPPNLPLVDRSVRLREAIKTAIQSGLFGPGNFQVEDFDVEGLAMKDGRMTIGFRAPVTNVAFIMTVSAEAVFGTGNLNIDVRPLKLGEGIGIRDLATISTGILVLTGPAADLPAPSLFHIDNTTGAVSLLGNIVEPTNRKAETLLVLHGDPEFVRFLLLFEGVENGAPIEYFVSR